MFERLIAYYATGSPEIYSEATLEDVALLTALRESYAGDAESAAKLDFVAALTEAWRASESPTGELSGSSYLHAILNPILDRFESNGVSTLGRSELALMGSAHRLLKGAGRADEYVRETRLLDLLAPMLSKQSDENSTEPGLSGLAGRVLIISSTDLLKAPLRSIENFAGLHMPARGHVFAHTGTVRVVDDVPDSCMLVVEEGDSFVSGHVLGRVASSGQCCVGRNISGIAVTSRGGIRARAILNRAHVVSTWGSVHAWRTESPELVFAGESIIIESDAHAGVYAAPTIEVGGTAQGGDYSFSESLRSERFSATDVHTPVIQLCTKISFETYGGLADTEATEILSHLARLRQVTQNQQNFLTVAVHECEQYANNAIIYLIAGENQRRQIDDLNRAQRRLAFLDRIIAGIESLTTATERHLALTSRKYPTASVPVFSASDWDDILDLQAEFVELESEGAVDTDLTKESEALRDLSQKVRTLGPAARGIMLRLHEKKMNWLLERKTLLDTIREKEDAMKAATGNSRTLEAGTEGASRVQLLSRLLASVDKRAQDDPIRTRSEAGFIQVMLKTIHGRRERVKTYKENLDALKIKYEELAEMLMEKYRIPAPGFDPSSAPTPEVTGCFDDGVTLFTERYLLDLASAPKESLIVTQDCGPAPKTYRREKNVIVEVEEAAFTAS